MTQDVPDPKTYVAEHKWCIKVILVDAALKEEELPVAVRVPELTHLRQVFITAKSVWDTR